MRKLGDKIGSKLIAEEVGVPVAPWSRGGVDTLDEALGRGRRDRLPADAQGHRRRRRPRHPQGRLRRPTSRTPTSAPATRPSAPSAAAWSSSSGWSPAPGTSRSRSSPTGTAPPGPSACATARSSGATRRSSRSPPRPLLDAGQTDELKASAERLALAVGYAAPAPWSSSTTRASRRFAFLEVNTRLQVEHPITEVDHRPRPGQGADPRRRRRPARGREAAARRGTPSRPGSTPRTPTATSRPSPGRIALLELPVGPRHPGGHRRRRGRHHPGRLRLDDRQDHRLRPHPRRGAGPAAAGDGRDHRRDRGRRHQQELHPRPARPARGRRRRRAGPDWADTGWIDRVRAEGRLVVHRHSGIALVAAGIEAYEDEAQVEIARLLETAHGGRPQVQHKVGRAVDLKLRGTSYKVTVAADRAAPLPGHASPPATSSRSSWTPSIERLDEFHARLTVGGRAVPAGHRHPRARPPRRGRRRHPPRQPRRGRRAPLAGPGAGRRDPRSRSATWSPAGAPGPRAGDHEDGDGAARAVRGAGARAAGDDRQPGRDRRAAGPARAGRRRRRRGGGRRRQDGPEPRPAAPSGTDARRRSARRPGPRRPGRAADGLRRRPADARPRSLDDYLAARDELAAEGVDVVADEIALLGAVRRLRRAQPQPARPARSCTPSCACTAPRSTSTPTCRASTPTAAGCPQQFRDRLARVLAHYGVDETSSARPALEEAVFRVFLAQQRSAPDVQLATALLQRWIAEPAAVRRLATRARELLERLVRATQLRFPVVGRPGAQRPVPLVRPAAGRRRSARACSPASATRSPRSPPTRTRPTAPSASRRWPRSPSRSSASSPSGSRTAYPSTSRCSRC